MATALVTQIAYAVQTLFDPAGTAGRLVDLGKLANYGLLTSFTPAALFTTGVNGAWYDPSDINLTWRRNLLTYSEQFDNAVWVKIRCTVVPNATASPDGTVTAEKLVEDTSLNSHPIATTISVISGQLNTLSVYAKASERTLLQLSTNAGGAFCTFDLSSGAVVAGVGLISSAGSGWYRCQITYVPTASSDTVYIWPVVSGTTNNYQGDGTSGIYIWGAQLELGSTATPYQRITDGIQDYLQYQAQPVLYRDAAGTTPVTGIEQPVGLMLDKSKGLVLGPELVTNGDFSNGTTGWILDAGWTVSNGVATTTVSVSKTIYQQSSNIVAGKSYKVTYTASGASVNAVRINVRSPSDNLQTEYINLNGPVSVVFTATTSGAFGIYCYASGVTIDNISVRELPGNHAFNPSGNSANFPVLSARYNLLTKTEQFDDAVWGKTGTSVTPNTVVAPNGTLTSDKLVEDTSNGAHVITQAATISAGVTYVFSVYLKAAERSKVMVMASSLGSLVNVDLASGTLSGGSGLGYVSSHILDVGSGWYKVALTYTESTSGSRSQAIYLEDAGGNTYYQGNGTSGIYIWGADLRVANDALNQPAYQRVNTATDYDTVGFKPYLSFNGVNQWLQTNSIDFSYGDKMFVCAGVRKLSDATSWAQVCELSSNGDVNNGSFQLVAPGNVVASEDYKLYSRGTLGAATSDPGTYLAPITNVLSGICNISAPSVTLRVNGTQVAQATITQGNGNYGNYPLYIGARAGSSLWFNGRLYGLILAGKQASASEIASTEAYLNQKTGAY